MQYESVGVRSGEFGTYYVVTLKLNLVGKIMQACNLTCVIETNIKYHILSVVWRVAQSV
jgi:hypothetical protein